MYSISSNLGVYFQKIPEISYLKSLYSLLFKVGSSDIWFQSLTSANIESSSNEGLEEKRHIEKSFFFSVEDVQYNREVSPMITFPNNNSVERSPTHILTVTGAKGAWTQSNRDMAFSLYDSWRRASILREQVRNVYIIEIY